MIPWIIGAAAGPFAAALLLLSFKSLFLAASHSSSAVPFLAGFSCAALAWLLGQLFPSEGFAANLLAAAGRRAYIFGHELSHALAAWISGGKVFSFHVGRRSGHVELDKSNAVIALAPYCLPVYTAAVLLTWRLWLVFKPHAPAAPFQAMVGLTLAFHLTKTLEYLWGLSQPDLKAAGGILFSLSSVAAANGFILLLLAKALFPRSVFFTQTLSSSWSLSSHFWARAAHLLIWAAKAAVKR